MAIGGALLLLQSCGGDGPAPPRTSDAGLPVEAAAQPSPAERLPVSPGGGQISYRSGVILEVPGGALRETANVAVTANPQPVVTMAAGAPAISGTPVGVSVRLEPSGLTFEKPIIVRVRVPRPMAPMALTAVLVHDDAQAGFVPAKLRDGSLISGVVSADGTELIFATDHFSAYTAVLPDVLADRFTMTRLRTPDGVDLQLLQPSFLFHNTIDPTIPLLVPAFRAKLYEDLFVELFRAAEKPRPPLLAEMASKLHRIGAIDPIEKADDLLTFYERYKELAGQLRAAITSPLLKPFIDRAVKLIEGVHTRLEKIVKQGTIKTDGDWKLFAALFKCALKGFLKYLTAERIDRGLTDDRIAAFRALTASSPVAADPAFLDGIDRAVARLDGELAANETAAGETLDKGLGELTAMCAGEVIWDIGRKYVTKSVVSATFGTAAGAAGADPFTYAAIAIIEDFVKQDIVAANRNAGRIALMGSLYYHGGFRELVTAGSKLALPESIDIDDEKARHRWVNTQTALDLLTRIGQAQRQTVTQADLSLVSRGISVTGEWLAGLFGGSLIEVRKRLAEQIDRDLLGLDVAYQQVTQRFTATCNGDAVACRAAGTPIPAQSCLEASQSLRPLATGEPLRDFACAGTQRRHVLHPLPGRHRYSLRTLLVEGSAVTAAAPDAPVLLILPTCDRARGCIPDQAVGGTVRTLEFVFDSRTGGSLFIAVAATADTRYLMQLTAMPDSCQPMSCAAGQCGALADGCGGTLACGACQDAAAAVPDAGAVDTATAPDAAADLALPDTAAPDQAPDLSADLPPPPPPSPTLSSPPAGGSSYPGTVLFTWLPSAEAARYHLLVCSNPTLTAGCLDPDGGSLTGVEPPPGQTNWSLVLPAPGTYYWSVRAIRTGDVGGWGAFGEVRTFVVLAMPDAQAPDTSPDSGPDTAPPAQLAASPANLDFGAASVGGTPSTRTTTLSNSGGATTGAVSLEISGSNAADFLVTADTCTGALLAPAGTCTVTVRFSPAASGSRLATLAATASPGGMVTVALSGTSPGQAWQRNGAVALGTGRHMAVHPGNPLIIYLATGDGGLGLAKTTDGGQTWNQSRTGIPGAGFMGIGIAPSAPSTIYLGTYNGMYVSTDDGVTWTQRNSGLPATPFDIGDVAVHPTDPSTVFITTATAVFKTTDAGLTWAQSDPAVNATGVAFDPTMPSRVWSSHHTILRGSTDGGQTWTQKHTTGAASTYFGFIRVDPANPSNLYVGSNRGNGTTNGVYVSRDGGTSWNLYATGFPAFTATHELAIDPSQPGVVYVSTYTGVYKSKNHGQTWQHLNTGTYAPNAAIVGLGGMPAIVYAIRGGDFVQSVTGGE